jgi:hypothetical protein
VARTGGPKKEHDHSERNPPQVLTGLITTRSGLAKDCQKNFKEEEPEKKPKQHRPQGKLLNQPTKANIYSQSAQINSDIRLKGN